MKECGIFRGEVRTYFDPSYLFSGVKTPSTTVIYALGNNTRPAMFTYTLYKY